MITRAMMHETRSVEETKRLAAALAELAEPGDIILMRGDLGAGKTQFSQGFAAGLGVADAVTSPTFNILLEYHDGRLPLYHFDLYRLEEESELEDVGYYDVVEGDGVSLVEWADKFPGVAEGDYVEMEIVVLPDGGRNFVMTPHGARPETWLDTWNKAVEKIYLESPNQRA